MAGKVAYTVLMIEGGAVPKVLAAVVNPTSTPGKVPIVKRRRQGGGSGWVAAAAGVARRAGKGRSGFRRDEFDLPVMY